MMLIRASLLILILWCNTSHAGLFGNDEELEALRKQASAMEARIAKMENRNKQQLQTKKSNGSKTNTKMYM